MADASNNSIEKLLSTAAAEVGTATSGSGANGTLKSKYAAYLDSKAGFYNGKKNGYDYCAMFVDWCFVEAFGLDTAKSMTFHTIDGAGCGPAKRAYENHKRFFAEPENEPKKGDEVFFSFNNNGKISHTGIVYEVHSTYIVTIEGNTGNSSDSLAGPDGVGVHKKKRLRNAQIVGYGRPNWDDVISNPSDLPAGNSHFLLAQNDEPLARIKFKRGTAEDWDRLNIVLKYGQPGYDKTNNKLKIGDGETAWKDLQYISIDNSKIANIATNFIEEEEKNDTYYVRKWSSGLIECFGKDAPTVEIKNMFSSILYEATYDDYFEITGYYKK